MQYGQLTPLGSGSVSPASAGVGNATQTQTQNDVNNEEIANEVANASPRKEEDTQKQPKDRKLSTINCNENHKVIEANMISNIYVAHFSEVCVPLWKDVL